MIKSGPKIKQGGLIFCLDTADIKGLAKAGCMGFNNAEQLIKNIVSTGDTITSTSDLRLGNLSYFTLYGLTYPESSQTPASRDGITAGFNDIVSALTYDASRDLNYYVWDNVTNTWVADSYFNGERQNGHCYDTYDGLSGDGITSEHTVFQNDHAAIKTAYPDATHIVIGSHAAENNDANAGTLAILQDIGGASSWPTDRAEYVLIGKPGLGADNAYVWQYQNNSVNVAHANVGLPILGHKGSGANYLDFNGTDQYISLTATGTKSVEVWFNPDDVVGAQILYGPTANGHDNYLYLNASTLTFFGTESSDVNNFNVVGSSVSAGTWNQAVSVIDGNNVFLYLNGSLVGNVTKTFAVGSWSGQASIGTRGNLSQYFFDGKIAICRVYSNPLTSTDVLYNYNATKQRFNL